MSEPTTSAPGSRSTGDKPPLSYYPLKAFIFLWSLHPMPLLHLQSSCLALLLRYILRYRKTVVFDNLSKAFPEKTAGEIKNLAWAFYKNFCDVIVETVKLASISPENLKKRVPHQNPEVIPEMIAHGGGGIAVFAHYCNWEWLGAGMGLQLPFETVGVYKRLKNRAFDHLILHLRCRLGNQMIRMEQTYRESHLRLKSPCYIAFLGDQAPNPQPGLYFSPLLGRPAAVQTGIATICLKMDVPLYYFDIRRIRRGRYSVELRKIPHEDLMPYSRENAWLLTDRHVAMLEEIIRREPANWLWSHRRWKRRPGVDSEFSIRLSEKNQFPAS